MLWEPKILILSPSRRSVFNMADEVQRIASTPTKYKEHYCAICSNISFRGSCITSERGRTKNLKGLILRYGGIDVVEGIICRSCETLLLHIDEKCVQLKKLCLRTAIRQEGTKRLRASPATKTTPQRCNNEKKEIQQINKSKNSTVSTCLEQIFEECSFDEKVNASAILQEHSYFLGAPTRICKKSEIKSSISSEILGTLKNTAQDRSVHFSHTEQQQFIFSLQFGSNEEFVTSCMRNAKFKSIAIHQVVKEERQQINGMGNTKHGFVSSLIKRKDTSSYDCLSQFNWESVVKEFKERFPVLFQLIVGIMTTDQTTSVDSLFPRISLIYGVLAQTRNKKLSLVQRIVSSLLTDSLCDVKVYDRLNHLGVCLSYSASLGLLDSIKGDFNSKIIDAIKSKKRIRLVGDNVNFKVSVRDERKNHHAKMCHYFGSAVLAHDLAFPSLSADKPQKDYKTLLPRDLLPSRTDMDNLLDDYVFMSMKVASEHLTYFSFLKELLPNYLTDTNFNQLLSKTLVVPLSVLPKNEQEYGDVVDILKSYENTVKSMFEKAGDEVNSTTKVHIGGDQLTRERFSGAKRLMIGAPTEEGRFQHLTPITSEFFHLDMKFLALPYKHLFKLESGQDIGTMRAEQIRIQRHSVNASVKDNYSADKEFFISFVDSYIVEMICNYFELIDTNAVPPNKLAPADKNECLSWAEDHFKSMLRKCVGTFVHKNKEEAVLTLFLFNFNTLLLPSYFFSLSNLKLYVLHFIHVII